MTPARKQALLRFGKVAGAAVIAAAVGYLTGPNGVDVFGKENAALVTLILIPLLSALEKLFTGPTTPVEPKA